MPFANYKFPEGTLTAQQKEEIIHRTTDLFAHYLGDGVRPFSMVLVDEVVDRGWGRADEVVTPGQVGAKKIKILTKGPHCCDWELQGLLVTLIPRGGLNVQNKQFRPAEKSRLNSVVP